MMRCPNCGNENSASPDTVVVAEDFYKGKPFDVLTEI